MNIPKRPARSSVTILISTQMTIISTVYIATICCACSSEMLSTKVASPSDPRTSTNTIMCIE